jgi:hypothetical protein
MRTIIAATLGLAWSPCVAIAESASRPSVPFVGCAADGQMGPLPAPGAMVRIPVVRAAAAERLAYYASEYLGVLAPRGWHCFTLYGSGGALLLVTPELHDAKDLFRSETRLSGPAIELSRAMGGTSGRFGVARIAARVFPVAKPFVEQVIEEGILRKDEFVFGPYANDTLTLLSDTEIEFVTPGGSDGLGTTDRIVKNSEPVSGVAILLPKEDMDLVKLNVRLPPGLRDLSSTIITTVERNRGAVRRAK